MSKRNRSNSTYSSYYGREKVRRVPSLLPYLLVILIAGAGLAYFHFFVFKSVQGKVSNAYTGVPMAGVTVAVRSRQSSPEPAKDYSRQAPVVATPITLTTDVAGVFSVEKLPPEPMVLVAAEGFSPQQVPVAEKRQLDIKMSPNILRGKVTSPDGKPVAGASVWAGTARTLTKLDGSYLLKDIPAERRLVVKAPGYLAETVQFGLVVTQDVKLEPFVARAVYLNADTVATPGSLQALLDLVDRTELNAVVLDVKADTSGFVLYDSKLPEVEAMGASNQIIPDLSRLMADLDGKHIYSIARLSVFWDQALTGKKPEWAIKSKKNPGQPWIDSAGKRWANPYVEEVWDYNIAIAKEVAERGFDEVQFDFTQFPSDGDFDDMDFGPAQAGRKRVDAIGGFLEKAYKTLSPLGVYVGCNVLGGSPLESGDMGVGQQLEVVAAHTDYVNPTIYPAYFSDGTFGIPKPAEQPGPLVGATMKEAAVRVGATQAKVRPWLQDFSVRVTYDAPLVRAQIDAAEQNGAVGWMLWNFGNVYTAGALKGP